MDCQYDQLQMEKERKNDKGSWTPLLRQLFITHSIWSVYFLNGLAFGIPTVMIPQIRKEANSTDAVSPEMASWLYSVFGYSALPWVVIICITTHFIGRKIPFLFVNLNIFAYYNLLYFGTTLNQILIAEIMQGVTHAANISLSVIIVTEYIAPVYRGFFSTVKSAGFVWGVWVSNAIGTFFHWRNIPLVGIITCSFNITVVFWPESPQWLASKGQFEKCKKVHRWLRGTDAQAEKELEHLIESQLAAKKPPKDGILCRVRSAITTIKRREYYLPLLLCILVLNQYQFSGKLVCMMYAIEIIKKITDSESAAYRGMLMLDAFTVVGLFIGCILSKFLNRRTLFLSSTFIGIVLLLIAALYLFLVDIGVLLENTLVTLVLLVLFSIAASMGQLILATTITGEIIPLRYKSSISLISALIFVCLTSTLLKAFPFVSAVVHISGTFLILAIISFISCLISYIYLPETKDKSLQEIEELILGKKAVLEEREQLSLKQ